MGINTYLLCKLPFQARDYKKTAIWANSFLWFGNPPTKSRNVYKQTLGVDEKRYQSSFEMLGSFEWKVTGFKRHTIYEDSILIYLDDVSYPSVERALVERKQGLWSIKEIFLKVKSVNPDFQPIEFLVFPENSVELVIDQMKFFLFDDLISQLNNQNGICNSLDAIRSSNNYPVWHGVLNTEKTEIRLKNGTDLIWRERRNFEIPKSIKEWEYMDLLHSLNFMDIKLANQSFVFEITGLEANKAIFRMGVGQSNVNISLSNGYNDTLGQLLDNLVMVLDGSWIYYLGVQGERFQTLIYCGDEDAKAQIYIRNMGNELLVLVFGGNCPFLIEDIEEMAFTYGFNSTNAVNSPIWDLSTGVELAFRINKTIFSKTVFKAYNLLVNEYGIKGIKERWSSYLNSDRYQELAWLSGSRIIRKLY